MPLHSLRQTPKSRGIVIPVGKRQFRFAAHLITALRKVLSSSLEIAVAYAGDKDLPIEYRTALISLGHGIRMLDIAQIFNDDIIQVSGSWSIKPFAMLASPFSETILLDADTVLFQDPAIVFSYPAYQETGTYFFHDRLLWQHAYRQRHEWWEKEVGISLGKKGPEYGTKPTHTKAITKSKVYLDDYAEEQDSGMVVMNKSKLELVAGLLHICWQNTPNVRDITYARTYGDKESWWFGLELCGVKYSFEENYGSIAGEKKDDNKVCSFTIAHPDALAKDKLLWYNGSLLKNKAVNVTEFTVPEYWMIDAMWRKGPIRTKMSCMVDGKTMEIRKSQVDVIRKSIEAARAVDEKFKELTKL